MAPNAHGLDNFESALREGKSGIKFDQRMADLNFGGRVGGIPENWEEKAKEYFSSDRLIAMNELIIYASIAAIDAWKDAGLPVIAPDEEFVYWDTGAIIGIGGVDLDTVASMLPTLNSGKVKRLGSTIVERVMASAPSARITELLALGGQGTTVSSACTTGTDALINSVRSIQHGYHDRMVAGGVDTSSLLNWGGFDAMKVISRDYNETPEKASRPMSASAAGFVPGSGAGILVLEELETAKKRGARIYAEVIGTALNGGGHRMGGSMTFPNPESVRRAVRGAISEASIEVKDIDLINGHLTATMADPTEIENWRNALDVTPENFPHINATKSMIGHCLGAAGGIEAIGVVLQLHKGFIHGSINCEDLHPDIMPYEKSVVRKTIDKDIKIVAKSSFGFGDVNGVMIWKKWEE